MSKVTPLIQAAIDAEREQCAAVPEVLATNSQQIRLHCGELTAAEMRLVKATLNLVAFLIKTK